ncbi:MAG: ribonuclease HII [Candidatus Nanopelagicales bacterium]
MSVRLPSRAPRRRVNSDGSDTCRYERALARAGFVTVAGVDEAGRGACAGPLVVAAVVLGSRAGHYPRIDELTDSKLLTALARERVYDRVVERAAAWSVVVIDAQEIDRIGLHVANIEGMRRALARTNADVDYVLSDGYPVPGIPAPSLGMWKGDQVSASVAAAGVIAKVTRDRILVTLHERRPEYGFDVHKGYVTADHRQALAKHGPCDEHRFCFEPVRLAASVSHSGVRSDADDVGQATRERSQRHGC